jgi:hypothetical protein
MRELAKNILVEGKSYEEQPYYCIFGFNFTYGAF